MKAANFNLFMFLVLSLLVSCSSTPGGSDSNEKKAEILYGQGTSDLINKEYTSALKNLLEADKLKPDDPQILNNLGMAYYFKSKPDKAIYFLNKSIKLDNNSDARNNLASLYFEQKNYELAEKEYNAIRNDLTYIHQYRTYYALSLIKIVEKDTKKAKEYLKQSILENDEYCPAHFKIGELEFEASNFKDALIHFQKASQGTCLGDPAPRYYQGLSLIKLKKNFQAKEIFEDIKEKFPEGEKYSILATEKIGEINKGILLPTSDEKISEEKENTDSEFKEPLF